MSILTPDSPSLRVSADEVDLVELVAWHARGRAEAFAVEVLLRDSGLASEPS